MEPTCCPLFQFHYICLSFSMSQFFCFYPTKIFFHSLEGHHIHHPHYRLGTFELSLSFFSIPSFLHDPCPLCIMIYAWYSILRNPFQQTSSLIHNFMDFKYLPVGPWKNSLSTSLSDLIASITISVMYPSKMLLTQNLTFLEIGLLRLSINQINKGM